MGQKVNPVGLRLALNKNWSSRWYAAKKNFGDWLLEDMKVRDFIKKNYNAAAISKVLIERCGERVRITIFAARPGILIGRKGADLETLKTTVAKLLASKNELILDVVEVSRPDTDAQLVGEGIAAQLERRISFRLAMKQCMQRALTHGLRSYLAIKCSSG